MASLQHAMNLTGSASPLPASRTPLRLFTPNRVAQAVPAEVTPENRLEHLFSVLPAGIVVIDGYGIVRECNDAAIDILGEPLLGLNWLEIIQRSFSPRHDDGHEVSLKDGRRIRIDTRGLAPEPGQVVVLTDLTETREKQARLNRQERLSTIGRMLASLAHQIRTPLATAVIYAGHLRNPELEPTRRQRFAERLLERLRHLEQQINDMLVFARGESAIAERFEFGALLNDFRNALDVHLSEQEACLSIEGPDQAVGIIGNAPALLGALQNLAQNSLQAGGRGTWLSVKCWVEEERMLVIRFADNGPGIPPALAEHIFEPFYTTKAQGTGLGLAVVKSVIEAHQGQIRFNPASRGGAEFIIELPCQPLASAVPGAH